MLLRRPAAGMLRATCSPAVLSRIAYATEVSWRCCSTDCNLGQLQRWRGPAKHASFTWNRSLGIELVNMYRTCGCSGLVVMHLRRPLYPACEAKPNTHVHPVVQAVAASTSAQPDHQSGVARTIMDKAATAAAAEARDNTAAASVSGGARVTYASKTFGTIEVRAGASCAMINNQNRDSILC
jgi:hypothetical protein